MGCHIFSCVTWPTVLFECIFFFFKPYLCIFWALWVYLWHCILCAAGSLCCRVSWKKLKCGGSLKDLKCGGSLKDENTTRWKVQHPPTVRFGFKQNNDVRWSKFGQGKGYTLICFNYFRVPLRVPRHIWGICNIFSRFCVILVFLSKRTGLKQACCAVWYQSCCLCCWKGIIEVKREIKFTTNIFFEENLNDEEVSPDLGNFSLLLIKLAAALNALLC